MRIPSIVSFQSAAAAPACLWGQAGGGDAGAYFASTWREAADAQLQVQPARHEQLHTGVQSHCLRSFWVVIGTSWVSGC
jgi:hypothetical protein